MEGTSRQYIGSYLGKACQEGNVPEHDGMKRASNGNIIGRYHSCRSPAFCPFPIVFPSTDSLLGVSLDHMCMNLPCYICLPSLFPLTSQTSSIITTCTPILFRRHCPNFLYSSSSSIMLCSKAAEYRCSAPAGVTLIRYHFRRVAVGLV